MDHGPLCVSLKLVDYKVICAFSALICGKFLGRRKQWATKKDHRPLCVSLKLVDYKVICAFSALICGKFLGRRKQCATKKDQEKLENGYKAYLEELENVDPCDVSDVLNYRILEAPIEGNKFHENSEFNRPKIAGETDVHYKILSEILQRESKTYFDQSDSDVWEGDKIPEYGNL